MKNEKGQISSSNNFNRPANKNVIYKNSYDINESKDKSQESQGPKKEESKEELSSLE
jgi:hypothetical protein